MKVYYDLDLERFEAWSGAISTLDRIRNEGECKQLEFILEDLYPEGMDETALNDLLWFESETVFEWLGMRTEDQIKEEIEEKQEEIANLQDEIDDLMEEYDDGCIGLEDWETKEMWEDLYKDDIEDLKDQIAELKEEVSELEEELKTI